MPETTDMAPERIARVHSEGAKDLDLRSLGLTSLPPEISALTQLQTLNLNNNQLTSLPPEISALTQLRQLNLAGNQLVSLRRRSRR